MSGPSLLCVREFEVAALRRAMADLLAALKEAALHMPSGRARADAMRAIRKHTT